MENRLTSQSSIQSNPKRRHTNIDNVFVIMESVRENQGVLTICVQDKQTENLSEINLKS